MGDVGGVGCGGLEREQERTGIHSGLSCWSFAGRRRRNLQASLIDYRPKKAGGGSQACELVGAPRRTITVPGSRIRRHTIKPRPRDGPWRSKIGSSTAAQTAIDGCSLVNPNQRAFLSGTFLICHLVEKRLTLKLAHSFVSEATDLSIRSCCA